MIDIALVQKLAHLSRLGTSDEEAQKFAGQLDGIVSLFSDLQNLETQGVRSVSQITGLENSMRSDEAISSDISDNLLKCSRNPIVDDHIVVPKAL